MKRRRQGGRGRKRRNPTHELSTSGSESDEEVIVPRRLWPTENSPKPSHEPDPVHSPEAASGPAALGSGNDDTRGADVATGDGQARSTAVAGANVEAPEADGSAGRQASASSLVRRSTRLVQRASLATATPHESVSGGTSDEDDGGEELSGSGGSGNEELSPSGEDSSEELSSDGDEFVPGKQARRRKGLRGARRPTENAPAKGAGRGARSRAVVRARASIQSLVGGNMAGLGEWTASERHIALQYAARQGFENVDYEALGNEIKTKTRQQIEDFMTKVIKNVFVLKGKNVGPIEEWASVIDTIVQKADLPPTSSLSDAMADLSKGAFPSPGPAVPDYALIYRYLSAVLRSSRKLPALGYLERAVVLRLLGDLPEGFTQFDMNPIIRHLLVTYNHPGLDKPIETLLDDLTNPPTATPAVAAAAAAARASMPFDVLSAAVGSAAAASGTHSPDVASSRLPSDAACREPLTTAAAHSDSPSPATGTSTTAPCGVQTSCSAHSGTPAAAARATSGRQSPGGSAQPDVSFTAGAATCHTATDIAQPPGPADDDGMPPSSFVRQEAQPGEQSSAPSVDTSVASVAAAADAGSSTPASLLPLGTSNSAASSTAKPQQQHQQQQYGSISQGMGPVLGAPGGVDTQNATASAGATASPPQLQQLAEASVLRLPSDIMPPSMEPLRRRTSLSSRGIENQQAEALRRLAASLNPLNIPGALLALKPCPKHRRRAKRGI